MTPQVCIGSTSEAISAKVKGKIFNTWKCKSNFTYGNSVSIILQMGWYSQFPFEFI